MTEQTNNDQQPVERTIHIDEAWKMNFEQMMTDTSSERGTIATSIVELPSIAVYVTIAKTKSKGCVPDLVDYAARKVYRQSDSMKVTELCGISLTKAMLLMADEQNKLAAELQAERFNSF